MTNLRFTLLGTGFLSTFQLAGWLEESKNACAANSVGR